MRRMIFDDNRMKSLLKMYGVKSSSKGCFDLSDINRVIKTAFPGCWLQEYQRFPSPLGGYFGRWVISDTIVLFPHHRKRRLRLGLGVRSSR